MILNRIISLSKEAERGDVVFDLYQKSSTQERSYSYDNIKQFDCLTQGHGCFWSSIHDEKQLQKFFQTYVLQHQERLSRVTMFLSGMIGEEALTV